MKKKNLRKIYLGRQDSLSQPDRTDRSLSVSERFLKKFDLEKIRSLHVFLSIEAKSEIDTSTIFGAIWSRYPQIKTIVPRVDFEKDVLEHLQYDSKTPLKTSHWGIPEPVGDELVDENEIDLVLVPMLCFDERGYRVGHGKGYYDKFLVKCRDDCLKIGLSMFDPVERIEDVQDFDVSLDYCVTPEKIWKFS